MMFLAEVVRTATTDTLFLNFSKVKLDLLIVNFDKNKVHF